MATAIPDTSEGVSFTNGVGKAAVADSGDISMSIKDVEEAKAASARPFSLNLASGPPNLHPTVTTWQWLFSASDMVHTPSIVHSGLSVEYEKHLRWKGVQLIFRIGEYLRLGTHVMSTASIYFHRFYMRKALPRDVRERGHDTYTFQEMAPTCLFLACKVEETHKKLREVVEATMGVLDRSPQGMELAEARSYRPDVQSREYGRWKDLILLYEERLLETLCFDLIVEQPHPIAIKACKRLDTSRDMAQLTVVLLNALSYGAVSIFYDAATIAAGAFQKACNLVEVNPASYTDQLVTTGTWYDVFDVDQGEVDDAMADINEQLAHHDEEITKYRPTNPIQSQMATPLANTTSPNTPLHMKGDAATIATSASPQRCAQSVNEQSVTELKQEEDQLMEENTLQETLIGKTQMEEKHGIGNLVVDREDRTDASRPLSRRGSKGASLGPPPPLGIRDSSIEEKKDEINPVHEAAAALKVHHEQIQQEEGQLEEIHSEKGPQEGSQQIEGQQEVFQREEGQAEEGEIESEEEGAL